MGFLDFATFGLNAINSVLSGSNQKNQSKENRKQREWQEMMYERQKNDNLAQWNRMNEYNDPSNVTARLRQAGLNPDLVYSGSGFASAPLPSSASVPSASGSALPSVVGADPSTLLVSAQADLAEAQADKIRSETEGQSDVNRALKTNADLQEALKSGTIELQDISINLQKNAENFASQFSEEQLSKLRTEIKLLNKQVEDVNSQIGYRRLLMTHQQIENYFNMNTVDDKIEQVANATQVSRNELKLWFKRAFAQISALNGSAASSFASAAVARNTATMQGYEITSYYKSGLAAKHDRLRFNIDVMDYREAKNVSEISRVHAKQSNVTDGSLWLVTKDVFGTLGQLLGGAITYSPSKRK